MCLINFQLQSHPNYKLIVAANRDECYERPTAQAHFWKDAPEILAGRDLVQKGTWLGITKQGRFAALTNFRDQAQITGDKISRGEIVRKYLEGTETPYDFLKSLKGIHDYYDGFNIIVGNPDQLFYYSNRQDKIIEICKGTHGLSNHLLDTAWPKVQKGKKELGEHVMDKEKIQANDLFEILSDRDKAEDINLPQTGIGLELERQLSPLFIKTPNYGTRSSTVLLVDHNNLLTFVERTYDGEGFVKENSFSFQVG